MSKYEIEAALNRIETDMALIRSLIGSQSHPKVRDGRYIVENKIFTKDEAEQEIIAIRKAFDDGLISSDKRRGAIMRVTVQMQKEEEPKPFNLKSVYSPEEAVVAKQAIDQLFANDVITSDKRRGLKRSVTVRTA